VYHLLAGYIDQFADLEVAEKAIRYLLDRLDSREQREQLLEELLKNLGGRNAVLDSEMATLLGLLIAEKADTEAASSCLMNAVNDNKYNKLAFAKLAEIAPEQISPAMYLEHLRLALDENPLDMEAALAFAQYTAQLQLYQTAADAYEYCVDLFSFLHPSLALPPRLYRPWAISNYNTQRNQHKCLQIAEQLRQSGRFDMLLEAVAGKAAAKIGDVEEANRIILTVEEQAEMLLISESDSQQVTAEQLAWFYCFALPDADKAISHANRAYSIEPNSTTAAAILAYSLVMNGQTDWAGPLIENYEKNPIADLALAQIQLKEGQKDSAFELLKSVITAEHGSLEAQRAREILTQHGGEYIPPTDTGIILTALRNAFGQAVVPAFVSPEKTISVQLNVRGSKFYYGSKFDGSVTITNNSSHPLIISDDGLLRGNIRVDADVSGDINKKIPNLVSIKIRPALPIEPGRTILIPLRLVTGELKQILLTHPQASLDIEFTVFVDPVTTRQGRTTNMLECIKPAKVLVKRARVELSGKYLRNRLNSLSKGQQGQKIKAARLFAGLLAEQHKMANRQPPYKFMDADWMPAMLKSALVHNLADDDWVVKVHTMADMLSVPMDYEMINTAAENLKDTNWPTRLMAIYLLAKNQDSNFDKVLDHYAKYDQSRFISDMAIALGAAAPETDEPTK
jgi:tetratricopeptide (TPR) repeat protein